MTSLRRALIGLAVLAFAFGIGSLALVLSSGHEDSRGLSAALTLLGGWAFAGTGLFAWDRRPASRTGPLMTAVGFAWLFRALFASNDSVLLTLGAFGTTLPYAILAHLLVTFPSGRIETRAQRAVIGAGYFICTVIQVAWVLSVDPARAGCEGCPPNALLIGGHGAVGEAIGSAQVLLAIPAIASVVVLLYGRWRDSSATQRRILTPVLATGALAFAFLLVHLILMEARAPEELVVAVRLAAFAAFACLPFAFLAGLLRSRIGREEEIRTALTAENEQLTVALQAKIAELRASRTRIVEAGFEERRRVERDLHDGAQQRLVALAMSLRLVRARLEPDPQDAGTLLDGAMEELKEATGELRELARGIHPAVLSERGLEAALAGLADRSPVPVEIIEAPSERLPAPVESTTYFVIAEALTNVARYAGASEATVRVSRASGAVEVEVCDDGLGGANPADGTGLRGLEDRVTALEGRLLVVSPAGEGTTIVARIPCG